MNLDILKRRLTKEDINALPLRCYQGEVKIIRSADQWRQAAEDLREDGIVGFDTETRPSFSKGKNYAPSIMQLASEKKVYLVQFGRMPFGSCHADILADPLILKVGVGINEDMRALGRVYSFEAKGVIDIGEIANCHGFPSQGLRSMAASFFGWRISKGSQCSNWNSRQLTPRQISYAATDAWIGRMIYMRMLELGIASGESV